MKIPFNIVTVVGNEKKHINEAIDSGYLCGGGHFEDECASWFRHNLGACNVMMTPSCTHALEMMALLIGIKEGDEVIMPSYTFVSTANAFVLRGAKVVFVDIREDNLNIDETIIESAITAKTKAIVVVHYAGVACEMDTIMDIARRHSLYVLEDAALGYDGVLATMHESQISDLLKVNVQAPILLAKYSARSMLLKRCGRIVNIGSIIGSTGFSGLSVYGATKASLGGFTKSLSRELGKMNITVNTVAPGYMATEMTEGLQGEKLESIVRRSPLGRLADVSDVANIVAYLLSDLAGNITGATMTIDAGSTA